MTKLHELLAVEGDLRAAAQRALAKTTDTFSGKAPTLHGFIRHYSVLTEGEDIQPDESKELGTTTLDELEALTETLNGWWNVAVSKEITNQDTQTRADVKIGDKTLFTDLPATALLTLESKLAELRNVINEIPTLDPAIRWQWNNQRDVWQSPPLETFTTRKRPRSFIAYEATKEHPAQVQVFNEDIRVGKWETTHESGAIPPRTKREWLTRVDEISQAIKTARQRANDTEAKIVKDLATKVMNYIIDGTI